MAIAYDTLGYTKRLEDAGIPRAQAEAHANAAKDFIMAELVTKTDLQAALDALALRMTLRLGAVAVAVAGLLFAALKLT